ncbi:S8 family serine peptidase [uncultured Kocuria sp.]|uniref:S8 family serine peptidase n=1 Tax=uncultured Kocuria sp. TaxID=259305 RepID=UPI0025949B1E|nr:S8 family serine peptidase [uncultured Kocuria sp.]
MRSSRTLFALCLVSGALGLTATQAVAAPPTGPTSQQQSQTQTGDSSLAQLSGKTAAAAPTATVEDSTDRVVVKFKDNTPEATKTKVLQETGQTTPAKDAKIVKTSAANSDVVQSSKKLNASEQDQVVKKLSAEPDVEFAEADKIVKNATTGYPTTPNDPHFGPYQWNMRIIDAPGAWQSATGAGQTIGVVDTGTTNHPDLNSKVVSGYDFVSPDYDRDGVYGRDSDPTDPGVMAAGENWHGTHVEGIAAASTNNGIGVSGVAPDAKIQPVRAFGIGASGYVSDFADAITWASGGRVAGAPANPNPSTVVNFSAAWPGQCSSIMKSAVDGAASRNVPVVVAAGNSGVNANDVSPANCLGAVVVGATASSDVMTGYSNYGPMLDVVAPGGSTGADIWSTYNTGYSAPAAASYGTLNGTSMAAPHVAGLIALMKQRNPSLGVEQIRNILVSTGSNVGGYPRINAKAAVNAVAPAAGGSSTPVVVNGIRNLYDALGGASTFGNPRANERGGLVDGGVFQEFTKNYTIYWTPFTGTHSVNFNGAIGAKYRAGGYERAYGYPSSEEFKKNGFSYQWFKTKAGKSTLIMWTPQNGAQVINESGSIGNRWVQMGRENGSGFPTSDEISANGLAYQWFKKGNTSSFYMWSPATGTHIINESGAIGGKWANDGRESGSGIPTSDEISKNGMAYQWFKNGRVSNLYMWTPGTGAHTIQETSGIGSRWVQQGRENGSGFPTSDEVSKNGTAYQWFVKGQTSHFYMWTPATGTHIINESGGIGSKWANDGRENGAGVPTSEEISKNGLAYQWFKKGGVSNLYMWTPGSGTHTIIETGAIGGAWIDNGRENGWGAPTTDEYRGSDGKIHQKFSKGVEVTWSASEGVRVLR